MKILLAGGGSGGPAAPLLAVAGAIKKHQPSCRFFLVGTKTGPEGPMAESANIEFQAIAAGKLPRYFSVKAFLAPLLTLWGFFQALLILKKFRPDCVFGTGSFVQVPVIWAAWVLKIPAVIHQQDVISSLANKLCQFFVKKITVCFEKSLTDFSESWGWFYKPGQGQKIVLTGNPFRSELSGVTRERALKNLNLRSDLPVLLVLGGGTGSDFINRLIASALPELAKTVQVVHSLGVRNRKKIAPAENYQPFDFILDMASAYSAADIVVSRAGLSTLTELSNLSKVGIIIPMPKTHQEYNARLLDELRAALVFEQKYLTSAGLIAVIKKLLFNFRLQNALAKNISGIMPRNSAGKIAEVIIKLAEKHGE